jgi:uncharacterized membrane protein
MFGLAAAGQCRVRLELSYLLVGALFERNQFLNQKPINVIDCITAVVDKKSLFVIPFSRQLQGLLTPSMFG